MIISKLLIGFLSDALESKTAESKPYVDNLKHFQDFILFSA